MVAETAQKAKEMTVGVSVNKAVWRKRLKLLRETIPAEERKRVDAAITQRVLALPEYQAAQAVLAYLSFGTEVETRTIIKQAWADGKRVFLPRCVPDERAMVWYRVDSLKGLVRSPLGMEEPVEDSAREANLATLQGALVLVPGLAFDSEGNRLGYGGGYYDVCLPGLDSVVFTTVGLCRSCQMVSRVEVVDSHDYPVSVVVTESRVYRPKIR